MGLDTNDRQRYIVTPPLIGWAHTQNNPRDVQNIVYVVQVFLIP